MSPHVSVVVPTYDRRASLERLLRALAAQTYPLADVEVLVVDDGSTDGTAEWLAKARFPFELRGFGQAHGGPAAARNLGVRAARGALIVFLDDDVVPDPDLIATHVRRQTTGDTVVIGPMLAPKDWDRPAWIRWEEAKLYATYRRIESGRWPCTPRQFFTANASLPRERFLSSGGFDTTYRRAEDVELGYRLEDAGMRFVFEPNARVWHYPRRSFAAWRRTPYEYGRSEVRMDRDKGHDTLAVAFEEFQTKRHSLNRALARICVGRSFALAPVALALRAAVGVTDALRADRAAAAALSALYNLLYWQGVSDALGGRGAWSALGRAVPVGER
jgi:GT2 family glycosyltransferase